MFLKLLSGNYSYLTSWPKTGRINLICWEPDPVSVRINKIADAVGLVWSALRVG